MQASFSVRGASVDDASALLEIYRPYVEETAISFELVAPTAAEFAARIEKSLSRWCWLLAEDASGVLGYAYATSHRERQAYARSVETSAYVEAGHHRRGIARALYHELFDRLKGLGYASAYAGITLPNDPSVGFHRSLGFEPIGVFPRVGYKFDQWRDVAWMYRPISEMR